MTGIADFRRFCMSDRSILPLILATDPTQLLCLAYPSKGR